MAQTMSPQDVEQKKKQIEAASQAWHTAATQEEKDALHQQAVALRAELDAAQGTASTFDSRTGTWTTQAQPGAAAQNTPASPAKPTSSVENLQVAGQEQEKIKAEMAANSQAWHTADATTKQVLQERNKYLAGLLGGSVNFDSTTGTWSGAAQEQTPQPQMPQVTVPQANTTEIKSLLDAWKTAAGSAADAKVDYSVQQAVAELERALADAQVQYKEQAESVAKDERQALDNSALYAEMRGDKGGIGQAQYNEIQAAAAQNRLAVQQSQTKLATDTARQIADLRAQGEFEKADAALELAQTYLSQLISMEQWAAEYNMSAAQFQANLDQWQAEYNAAMDQWQAQATGKLPDGTPTLSAQQAITEQLVSMGSALLSAGVMPSESQLEAMGLSSDQANQYLKALQLQQAAKASSGGSGGGSGGGTNDVNALYKGMYESGDPYTYLVMKGYTDTEASNIRRSDGYKAYEEQQMAEQSPESGVAEPEDNARTRERPMSSVAWWYAKQHGDETASTFKTYDEYLKAFAAYQSEVVGKK